MQILIRILMLTVVCLAGCKSSDLKEDTGASYRIQTTEGEVTVLKKEERGMALFSLQKTLNKEDLIAATPQLAEQIATDAIKRAKLEISGPLMLVFQDLPSMKDGPLTASIGFPVKGKGNKLPKYQLDKKEAFKCLSLVLPTKHSDSAIYWDKLYELAAQQGYKISGESRALISPEKGSYSTELQLGLL